MYENYTISLGYGNANGNFEEKFSLTCRWYLIIRYVEFNRIDSGILISEDYAVRISQSEIHYVWLLKNNKITNKQTWIIKYVLLLLAIF